MPRHHRLTWLIHAVFSLGIILSSVWVMLMFYIQQPISSLVTMAAIGLWGVFALSILGIYFSKRLISQRLDRLLYIVLFGIVLLIYFSLDPKQDRVWDKEVAQLLHYERDGERITLHNVRNFDWQPDGTYIERWETRTIDLNQITGLNLIASYWMGPTIAHTLISFDLKDQAPLTFSIEIRKEAHESFSAIGGFFRKYELSLVAADEKDIVYTRSHIRGEQVYFFPLQIPQADARALFEAYLQQADELAASPKWYNTLTSNCTTLVFDMAQAVSQQPLPMDYRILASGYLPNYLYDLKVLDQRQDLKTWYQRAHINPKIPRTMRLSSQQYSELIRQGVLPQP